MVLGFHDVRFPDSIARNAVGGAMFSTDITKSKDTPREKRNINWGDIFVHKFDVSHGLKDQEQFEELKAFIIARRGNAYSFRFKDYGDFRVSQQVLGEASGVMNADGITFQLKKLYPTGLAEPDNYFERIITKPIGSSIIVEIDSGAGYTTVGFTYTVNALTGIVTFTSGIPSGSDKIRVSFDFDIPMRFDLVDEWQKFKYDAYQIYTWDEIAVVEDIDESIIE